MPKDEKDSDDNKSNSNTVGDKGVIALAKQAHLVHLSLPNNNVRISGALALAQNLSITKLNVANNLLGAEGAIVCQEFRTINFPS